MTRKRLSRVVPVRVTHQDAIDLRRWARERNKNVSEVIRDLIDKHRREPVERAEPAERAGEEAAA